MQNGGLYKKSNLVANSNVCNLYVEIISKKSGKIHTSSGFFPDFGTLQFMQFINLKISGFRISQSKTQNTLHIPENQKIYSYSRK